MADVEIYFTHGGSDYLLPFTDTEGVGWKNINGNMFESVSLISEGSTGYCLSSPGDYIVIHHNNDGLIERLNSATWVDSENGLLFEHGGTVDGTVVNTLSIFDITTRTWSTGTAGGGARKEHSAIVYGRKAYVYGGIDDDGNYLNSLYSYDLDTGTWTNLGTGGTARADFTMTVISGKIYITGGYNGSGGVAATDIYDISEGTWDTGGELSEGEADSPAAEPEPELISSYVFDSSSVGIYTGAYPCWGGTGEGGEYDTMWIWGFSTENAPFFEFLKAGKGGGFQSQDVGYGDGSVPGGGPLGYSPTDESLWVDVATEQYSFPLPAEDPPVWIEEVGSAPGDTEWGYPRRAEYDGYRYSVSAGGVGTKTNIATEESAAWSLPAGIDTDYTILGAKDGYVYLVDVETYEVEGGEGGEGLPDGTYTRLVLWLYNIEDDTWAKTTFDSEPWNNYELIGYEHGHTGLSDDDAIYIATAALGAVDYLYEQTEGGPSPPQGERSWAQHWCMIKIPMVSSEGVASYIVESGSTIYRINPSTRNVQTYDTSSDTWTTVSTADSDLPRNGLITMGTAGVPIIMGGKDSGGENNTDAYILNPNTGVVEAASASLISPHIGGSSAFVGTSLYIWGGTGSGYQSYMEVYDISTGTVETWDLTYYNSDSFWEALGECDTDYVRWTDDWDTCRAAVYAQYPDLSIESPDLEDTSNPYIRGDITVDGSPGNSNYNFIPGLNVQIIPSPHYAQRSRIVVGGIWDDSEGRVVIPQRFGFVPGGSSSATQTFKIKNVTGADLENITVRTINRWRIKQFEEASPFKAVRHVGERNPASKLEAGGYGVTFSNLDATAGTIDMLIGGNEHDIIDTTDDTVMYAGQGLKIDGATEYKFDDSSELSGLSFILATDTTASSVAEIHVSKGGDLWKIRESGETTWTRGNRGISLDDLSNNGTVEIDIQCNPRVGVSGYIEGILHVEGDTGSTSIVLSANVVDTMFQVFNVRATVIPQAVYNKMAEFGVTVAS